MRGMYLACCIRDFEARGRAVVSNMKKTQSGPKKSPGQGDKIDEKALIRAAVALNFQAAGDA